MQVHAIHFFRILVVSVLATTGYSSLGNPAENDRRILATSSCPAGDVCAAGGTNCATNGVSYSEPTTVCGGKFCPAATALWQGVNMDMMVGIMNLTYTADANIDFVRGMIPRL
jgi:hypothetical protein